MVILPSIRRKYMVSRIPWGATVPMSECVVTLASDRASYTGAARTVGVTVTWEGATLAVNTDYTLSFANNVNVGPATVTVTGMGQFSGSVTKTFYIVTDAPTPWNFDLANASFVASASLADGEMALTDIRNVQLLANGRLFFGTNGRMYVWSWTDGQPAPTYDSRIVGDPNTDINFSYGVNGAIMAKDGMTVVYSGNNFGKTWARYLVSAFDLSTMTSTETQIISSARGDLSLSSDGRHLATKAFGNNEIHVYVMDSAYDYANAASFSYYNMSNYDRAIIDATGESSGTWYGMSFSGDGLSAAVVWGACVLKLSFATAWDVETATLDSWFKPSQGTNWRGVGVNPAGDRMFLTDSSGVFYEYSLSA